MRTETSISHAGFPEGTDNDVKKGNYAAIRPSAALLVAVEILVVPIGIVPVEFGRVCGEKLGKTGLGALHVDAQQLVVIGGIKLADGDHLAAQQPGQAAGIQIAADKGLFAEMCDQRRKKGRVGTAVGNLAVAKTLAPDQGCCTLFIRAADAPQSQHDAHVGHEWPMRCAASGSTASPARWPW